MCNCLVVGFAACSQAHPIAKAKTQHQPLRRGTLTLTEIISWWLSERTMKQFGKQQKACVRVHSTQSFRAESHMKEVTTHCVLNCCIMAQHIWTYTLLCLKPATVHSCHIPCTRHRKRPALTTAGDLSTLSSLHFLNNYNTCFSN